MPVRKSKGKKSVSVQKKDVHQPKSFEKFDGTVGDYISEVLDNWFERSIMSGDLFTTDIYEVCRLMDNKNKLLLFEKLDKINLIELVRDYNHDFAVVKKWLDRYISYRILIRQSNKQLTYHSTTNEQVILYYSSNSDLRK